MTDQNQAEIEIQNEQTYEDLLVSIEASDGKLSLLIAVCDDSQLREQIIDRYETELMPQFRPYRVVLARGEPSLRMAIAQTVEAHDYLRQRGSAVLTVTGVEQLHFLKLGETRSERDIFFGYLQWTREGLLRFPFPIVIWVTSSVLNRLSYRAPDFWSWRKGVFRFISTLPLEKVKAPPPAVRPVLQSPELPEAIADSYLLHIQDLQNLIQQLEDQRGNDSLLASLYARLGQTYATRLERGEVDDLQAEQRQALRYLEKAAVLQTQLGLEADLIPTLNWLAYLYSLQEQYREAESMYLRSLELSKRLLGDRHPSIANSLNNLALLYESQGEYDKAEPLYIQALELDRQLLGENHPEVAASLNNLALLYKTQGRYAEAEPLYLQALDLNRRLLGENHPDVATSLNNLAMLYSAQGRYQEAESLYEQALVISQQIFGDNHPNTLILYKNLETLERSPDEHPTIESTQSQEDNHAD